MISHYSVNNCVVVCVCGQALWMWGGDIYVDRYRGTLQVAIFFSSLDPSLYFKGFNK